MSKGDIEQLVIVGSSAAGVALCGESVAEAAVRAGLAVAWLPAPPDVDGSRAPSASLIVSRQPIGSPLVTVPDVVLAMGRDHVERWRPRLKAGGVLFLDASAAELSRGVSEGPFRDDIRVLALPTETFASTPESRAMVLVGAYVAYSSLLTWSNLAKGLQAVVGGGKKASKHPLVTACRQGLRYIEEKRHMHDRYAYSIFMT